MRWRRRLLGGSRESQHDTSYVTPVHVMGVANSTIGTNDPDAGDSVPIGRHPVCSMNKSMGVPHDNPRRGGGSQRGAFRAAQKRDHVTWREAESTPMELECACACACERVRRAAYVLRSGFVRIPRWVEVKA